MEYEWRIYVFIGYAAIYFAMINYKFIGTAIVMFTNDK